MGVTIEEAFPVIEHVYPERTVRLYFFRCTPEKKDETLPSGSRARWVPLKEIDRYAFPEANKPILKLLRNYSWGES